MRRRDVKNDCRGFTLRNCQVRVDWRRWSEVDIKREDVVFHFEHMNVEVLIGHACRSVTRQ